MITAIVILGILVFILFVAVLGLGWYVIAKQRDNQKTFDTVSEALVEDWEKMQKYDEDYKKFEKFPDHLTKRLTEVELRCNKFDDVLRVMNQGFQVPTQSEMRNPYM